MPTYQCCCSRELIQVVVLIYGGLCVFIGVATIESERVSNSRMRARLIFRACNAFLVYNIFLIRINVLEDISPSIQCWLGFFY